MAKNYDLFLQGPVGGWDFDASYVDYVLDKFSDREVSVLVDSLGGKTNTALSICAAFGNHGNVTVHFQGMNASAATIASMGARKITIEDSAMYLVHKCSLEFFDWSMKNADQLESYIEKLKAHKEDLDKIDSHIAELYARKCKKPATDLLALMKKGGWLTPSEAKDWGFVDEIVAAKTKKKLHVSSLVASYFSDADIPLPPGCKVDDDEDPSWIKKMIENLSKIFNIYKMDNQQSNSQEEKPDTQFQAGKDSNEPSSKTSDYDKLKAKFEDYKKSKADEIDKLKSENEKLKKQPAEGTSSVVEISKPDKRDEKKTEFEEFIETTASANEFFNSLP